LLCTPMSDARIAFSKAAGVFIRCLPLWGLLVVHMVLFSLTGHLHPVSIVHAGLLVVQMVVFLSGLGLWLGSIFKRVSTAVPLTVVAAVALWVVVPAFLPYVPEMLDLSPGRVTHPARPEDASPPPLLVTLNPSLQALAFAEGPVREASRETGPAAYRYSANWAPVGAGLFTQRMAMTTAFYVGLGALFVWLTVRRMRRNIFR
ncbi:MAG TPA: hypothetical protein VFJ30_17465, partial [Phycisphaerae bacterium]|nr:hypothetical protein [Phycisphaerae bacterium]